MRSAKYQIPAPISFSLIAFPCRFSFRLPWKTPLPCFLPRDASGRDALFAAFAHVPGALIFFERKDRLKESLARAAKLLGPREAAVCRELTKEHEEFILIRLENSLMMQRSNHV